MKHALLTSKINHNIRVFLGIVTLLITAGILFIYSSSSFLALEKYGIAHYYIKKQLFGILLGLSAIGVIYTLPISFIKRYSPLLFFSSLTLTALTLFKKTSITLNASSRWLSLFGQSFQPSELLKVAFVLYISYMLVKKGDRLRSFWHGYIPCMVILGITSLILLTQPDFGSAITLTVTLFIMLFTARFNTSHALLSIGALLPIIGSLIYLKPYRWRRILTFLNPWHDPQGAGFQVIQSLIAIGSGSVWGIGIGHSKQKFFYLPMQHTDFIFSIIAEETGFVGSLIIVMLFVSFLVVGLRIASQVQDSFSAYAISGFVFITTLQAAINILVTTGLLPTKGLGLPFISYGLSALVCNMIMVGLILTMAKSNRPQHF